MNILVRNHSVSMKLRKRRILRQQQ